MPAALLGGPQAAALPAASAPASLAADRQPVCGDPDAKDFPIETRFQDAPDRYASGGGYGTWFLDLTNTTDTTCRALHPVLVLADRDRRLTSDQIQLEFSEPGRPGTEHRVTWESTDRDEQIGVFGGERDARREKAEGGEEGEAGTSTGAGTDPDTGTGTGADGSGDGFLGFTVPAGATVSVRVRMAFTSDTDPGPVTAHAAVVQRRHQDKAKGGGREDGEWVGESEDYAFVIVDGATGGIREPEQPRSEQPRSERPQPENSRSDRPLPERPRSESPDPEHIDPEHIDPERADPERADPGDGTRTDPGAGREPSPDRDPAPGRRPVPGPGRRAGAPTRSTPGSRPVSARVARSPNSPAPDRRHCPGPGQPPGRSCSAGPPWCGTPAASAAPRTDRPPPYVPWWARPRRSP